MYDENGVLASIWEIKITANDNDGPHPLAPSPPSPLSPRERGNKN
jgi:hypothetical protein